MVTEILNDPEKNQNIYAPPTSPLYYHKFISKIGKLVKGKNPSDYVPEGFDIEELPGKYILTSTRRWTTLEPPIILLAYNSTEELLVFKLSDTSKPKSYLWDDIINLDISCDGYYRMRLYQ